MTIKEIPFRAEMVFLYLSSDAILYAEYFGLFKKQLGFNLTQIGLTSLLGVPQLFIPLYLMFGEKLRSRKIAAFFGTLGLSVCCVLPLLAVIIPALQPSCYATWNVDRFCKSYTSSTYKQFSAFQMLKFYTTYQFRR